MRLSLAFSFVLAAAIPLVAQKTAPAPPGANNYYRMKKVPPWSIRPGSSAPRGPSAC